MNLNEIRDVLKNVYGESPGKIPFELIGFDACLMGSYECANNISGYARYMVASEESENGLGWYYTDWVSELAGNPASNGAILGEKICSGSLTDCRRINDSTYATFSVIDLTKISQLREAHEEYFTAALANINKKTGFAAEFDGIAKSSDTESYHAKNESTFYVDLKSLAMNTRHLLPQASDKLLQAIKSAVVDTPKNGEGRNGGGISTYYPMQVT